MIERAPFGRTGHQSSRVLFGAAALGRMRQERADELLEILLEFDRKLKRSELEPESGLEVVVAQLVSLSQTEASARSQSR